MFAELGWNVFEGSYGTAAGAPETDAAAVFNQAWQEAYGEMPAVPYLREINDAIYLIALAAEQAGSNDSAAIRDALREVANEPGTAVGPGQEGWQAAVESIDGGEDINYEGAAGPVDLDENGDVSRGAHRRSGRCKARRSRMSESRDVDLTADESAATPVS